MVTIVPTGPLVGVKPETLIAPPPPPLTVKFVELVPVWPPFVTEIGPVVAPDGTRLRICVFESMSHIVALVPLNFSDDAPVKPEPLIVTSVPTEPLVGLKLEIVGPPGGGGEAVRRRR